MTTPHHDGLRRLLSPRRLTQVVDIGANPIDGEPPYRGMLGAGLCRVIGFEPQPEAFAELARRQGPHETYLPYAISGGEAVTLRLCKSSGMASTFEPDPRNLALFDFLRAEAQVHARLPLATRRLDDVTEIEHLDFLKIDIQGGELAVFRAGTGKLAKAVGIQTEVSFVPLYQGQPAFGEVDLELRAQGFIPHCFVAVKRWPIAPCIVNNDPIRPLNQLIEADVCYVRDFSRPELMDDEQLKHLALLVHHCYGSVDLALRCIMLLEARGTLPQGSQQRYLGLIAAQTRGSS